MTGIFDYDDTELPAEVCDVMSQVMAEIFPVVEASTPESLDPSRGLEMCAAICAYIYAFAAIHYGEFGINMLRRSLDEYAVPDLRGHARSAGQGMN